MITMKSENIFAIKTDPCKTLFKRLDSKNISVKIEKTSGQNYESKH